MTETYELGHIDERLCFALYSTSKAIVKKYQPYLTKLKMTYPQYLVYIVLDEREELTVSELGDILFLDSGTLTPVLKRMEIAELVERNRATDDERKVFIKLTPKAKLLKDEIAAMQYAVSCSTGLDKVAFVALRDEIKALNSQLRND